MWKCLLRVNLTHKLAFNSHKTTESILAVFLNTHTHNYIHTNLLYSVLYTSQFENELKGNSDDRKKAQCHITTHRCDTQHCGQRSPNATMVIFISVSVGIILLLVFVKIKLKLNSTIVENVR